MKGARICLVTSGPVGSDPRLVKEADALHEAGARVRVVATNATALEVVRRRDEAVLRDAPWVFEAVPTGGRLARKWRALQRKAARLLWAAGLRGDRVARMAHDPLSYVIGRTAARESADLYIAHNLAALPAAFDAARAHGARLGFDAEDFHSGQLAQGEERLAAIVRDIELRYLPRCDQVTAASPGIARAYADACAIRPPTVVLNVFPLAQAPARCTAAGSASERRLYWFSQTVGPERGIEQVLQAMARSRSRPQLHLQGTVSADYRRQLEAYARQAGMHDALHFLPAAPPAELPRIAAQYDAGVASELNDTANRDLCLSNKIFTYLLGGLPVLASDTRGQRELARQLPGAVWVAPLHDTAAWAALIDEVLQPQALAQARLAAWTAAQGTYNWDREKKTFLQTVAATLAPANGKAQMP